MPGVRLEWDGKAAEVPRLHLPLQVVETGNAPRADRGTLFERCDVVLRVALASGAQEVVVAHNHVGRNAPSDADLAVTRRLVAAGAVVGIRLRAHLVVTVEGWYDCCEPGLPLHAWPEADAAA
jgi:hypothetical protein